MSLREPRSFLYDDYMDQDTRDYGRLSSRHDLGGSDLRRRDLDISLDDYAGGISRSGLLTSRKFSITLFNFSRFVPP